MSACDCEFSAHLLPLANKELLATPRFQTASLIKGPWSLNEKSVLSGIVKYAHTCSSA